ncbi:MAG: M24 family metallopeptidase [Ruminococcaceae bacterium]|nr:M24 family metallopeptidase [Oscillospiraceae bacterium]
MSSNLNSLRYHMNKHNISAVIIPTADMHLSEYISEHYKLREYISGFTGSAGTLVVSSNDAGLWTDGRYYIQAEKELKGSGIRLFKASEGDCQKIHEFLKETLEDGETIGVDGRLFSRKQLSELISKLKKNPFNTKYDPSAVWKNRPAAPVEKAFILDKKYSGEDVGVKLKKVREQMKSGSFTHYLTCMPECIMWLLNIRGKDVVHTPVVLSYLLMTDSSVTIYVDKRKITEDVSQYFKMNNIKVADYEKVFEDVSSLNEKAYLATDFSMTNYALTENVHCAVKDVRDFIYNLKCVKNDVEVENIKKAYVMENIALTKAFYEIYNTENLDECDVVDIIEKHRRKYSGYYSPAFDTIAAFGANAAMMHYSPEKSHCAKVGKSGFLLIDTGGQYFEGTTDTTRTLAMGNISDEMKEHFTLVLKSHIAIAASVFPDGTRCCELDALARTPLWKKGIDYRCSTGHGVGYMLGVHEGPQRLSGKCDEKLLCNMTVTDEPGVYVEGKFGIRTENHLCVKNAFETEYGRFLCFEVLNFCPVGTAAIMPELLSRDEMQWVNEYNCTCRRLILPYLTEEEAIWMQEYTKEI